MESWDITMAKIMKDEAKKRMGEVKTGGIIGLVVSKTPPMISILDGLAMLENKHLYLANGSDTFSFDPGQEVLLIPTQDNQTFFIVNKVIKL